MTDEELDKLFNTVLQTCDRETLILLAEMHKRLGTALAKLAGIENDRRSA